MIYQRSLEISGLPIVNVAITPDWCWRCINNSISISQFCSVHHRCTIWIQTQTRSNKICWYPRDSQPIFRTWWEACCGICFDCRAARDFGVVVLIYHRRHRCYCDFNTSGIPDVLNNTLFRNITTFWCRQGTGGSTTGCTWNRGIS